MRVNDTQLGRPQILYKATKVQIEATPNPQAGMIAFATDTNQIGIYTSGGWQWGSGGDMLKAVYDVDNDGIVDAAESVDWNGVQNKPSTYPPSSHQHAAADVTSGTFDAARIPNLDASKIASGTLSTDRFSAYNDLVAESKIGLITGRLSDANSIRFYYPASEAHDFTSTSLPSGWSWAGSPFVTPAIDLPYSGTFIRVFPGGNNRSFLYRTTNINSQISMFGVNIAADASSYVCIRYDDGTDNNYIEVGLYIQNIDDFRAVTRKRGGGGTVEVSTGGFSYAGTPFLYIYAYPQGMYSNWSCEGRIASQFSLIGASGGGGLSFTPTRVGFVFYTYSSWANFTVDAIG